MHIHYTLQMLERVTSCISERGSVECVWSQYFIQTDYTWGPKRGDGEIGEKGSGAMEGK